MCDHDDAFLASREPREPIGQPEDEQPTTMTIALAGGASGQAGVRGSGAGASDRAETFMRARFSVGSKPADLLFFESTEMVDGRAVPSLGEYVIADPGGATCNFLLGDEAWSITQKHCHAREQRYELTVYSHSDNYPQASAEVLAIVDLLEDAAGGREDSRPTSGAHTSR